MKITFAIFLQATFLTVTPQDDYQVVLAEAKTYIAGFPGAEGKAYGR